MESCQKAFDIEGLSLMIATPVIGMLDPRCAMSQMATVTELLRRGIPCEFEMLVSCSLLEKARSIIVEKFLASRHNRLLMLDADQTFAPKDVLRLLALSTELPVVCGAYPAKLDPPTFMVATDRQILEPGPLGTVKVDGVGLGFAMFDRRVLVQLEAVAPRVFYDGDPISHPMMFSTSIREDMRFMGEDMTFFANVRSLGYDVLVDPSLEIGHVGMKEYKALLPATKEVERHAA